MRGRRLRGAKPSDAADSNRVTGNDFRGRGQIINTTPRACEASHDEPRLTALLENCLSQVEQQELEEHVASCESCQAALDGAAAAPESWHEARRFLSASEVETLAHSPLGGGDLSFYRKMLGPSDDPRMLGRVGAYEIVGLLGRGGMGVVFKALDAALNRYVAIKMLSQIFAGSPIGKQRFLREAQLAAVVVPKFAPSKKSA